MFIVITTEKPSAIIIVNGIPKIVRGKKLGYE